ncbi:HAD family hydrolase [Sphingomonas sp. MMS24-JH45]
MTSRRGRGAARRAKPRSAAARDRRATQDQLLRRRHGRRADPPRIENAGLPARVVFSHGRLIDVIAPGGGKAAAIAAYAARHGWTINGIAAGDSGNDADMLGACGHAIIVGNAGDKLAALAPRAGLYRATGHHAAGVLEGLAAFGLAATTPGVAAAA